MSRVLSGCSGSCLLLGGVRVGCCAGVLFRVLRAIGRCQGAVQGGCCPAVLSRVLRITFATGRCQGAVEGAVEGAVQGAVQVLCRVLSRVLRIM